MKCGHPNPEKVGMVGNLWCPTCGSISKPIAFGLTHVPDDWKEPESEEAYDTIRRIRQLVDQSTLTGKDALVRALIEVLDDTDIGAIGGRQFTSHEKKQLSELKALADRRAARITALTERRPLTHVAIRFDGQIWSLPRPFRHHHIIRLIINMRPEVETVDGPSEDQGFLDERGQYLTRKQALVNAQLHDQIKNDGKLIGSVLTSEDLW